MCYENPGRKEVEAMKDELYHNILRLFLREGMVSKMTQMKRKYNKFIKKMGLNGTQIEIALLETCIEVAQERIAELKDSDESDDS